MQMPRLGAANVLRAVTVRGARAARRTPSHVATASVQYEYPTKVFPRELVKLAETEEYIYRRASGLPQRN